MRRLFKEKASTTTEIFPKFLQQERCSSRTTCTRNTPLTHGVWPLSWFPDLIVTRTEGHGLLKLALLYAQNTTWLYASAPTFPRFWTKNDAFASTPPLGTCFALFGHSRARCPVSRHLRQRARESSSLMLSRPSTLEGFPPLARPVTGLWPRFTRCSPRSCRGSL